MEEVGPMEVCALPLGIAGPRVEATFEWHYFLFLSQKEIEGIKYNRIGEREKQHSHLPGPHFVIGK